MTDRMMQVVRVGNVGASLDWNPEAFDAFTAAIYRAKIRILQLIEYDMVFDDHALIVI